MTTSPPDSALPTLPSADGALDIVGIGTALRAIPAESYKQVTELLCTTFRQMLRPITAITSGSGALIEEWFNSKSDVLKARAAIALADAYGKAAESNKAVQTSAYERVLQDALEGASTETDPMLREMWTSLLANEITDGDVHPEFVRILGRMSPSDARALIAIVANQKNITVQDMISIVFRTLAIATPVDIHRWRPRPDQNFNHIHLNNLGLIEEIPGKWVLTVAGRAFISAVSDPSIPKAAT